MRQTKPSSLRRIFQATLAAILFLFVGVAALFAQEEGWRSLVATGLSCSLCVDAGDIAADAVTEAKLKAVDAAGDEECLTFESAIGDFEWQVCGGGDSITVNASAASDPDFLNGDIDWTLTGGNSITATVECAGCVNSGDIAEDTIVAGDIDETGPFAFGSTTNTFVGASYTDGSGDPADSGVNRYGNAVLGPCWERIPTGTDICLSVNASEVFDFTNTIVGGSLAASILVPRTTFQTTSQRPYMQAISAGFLGIYRDSDDQLKFYLGLTDGGGAFQFQADDYLAWTSSTTDPGVSTPVDLALFRDSTSNLQLWIDQATANNQAISAHDITAGTSNTAGANFTVQGGQGTGTGAGGALIFQTAPAGVSGTAVNALATVLTLDSARHFISGGSAPALSVCGTTPAISGTDTAGKITIGTGATTSCTATFNKAYTNAPACTIAGDNSAVTYAATTTTTALTITSSANMASDVVSYICLAY